MVISVEKMQPRPNFFSKVSRKMMMLSIKEIFMSTQSENTPEYNYDIESLLAKMFLAGSKSNGNFKFSK